MSPTLRHPCPRCRIAWIASPAKYCPACVRARDVARGSPTVRGVGWALQEHPDDAALLKEEQRLARVVLDAAFSLARANWEN